MKKFTVNEIILLMFGLTASVVLLMIFAGLVFSNRPTTPENMDLRKELVALLGMIVGVVIGKLDNLSSKKSNE